jgi:hypothetical protein
VDAIFPVSVQVSLPYIIIGLTAVLYVLIFVLLCMMSDNKVRELATVCLPWQQWTETSVWCDDVGISAFHSCVVVDLW